MPKDTQFPVLVSRVLPWQTSQDPKAGPSGILLGMSTGHVLRGGSRAASCNHQQLSG